MINANDVKSHIAIFNDLINLFPQKIMSSLKNIPERIKILSQEIRIRVGNFIVIVYPEGIYLCNFKVSPKDLQEILNVICGYSVYTFQEQLKNGFITCKGGHRIGVASAAVIENGELKNIKEITSFNIRIAREFKGSAQKILNCLNGKRESVLIAGAPGSGKTTVLRDMARAISLGGEKKVTIVDERGEIGAAYDGAPQMDIALCDILTGFPKSDGILRATRCLSPHVIVCDEIGSLEDAKAIKQSLNSGVKIIASIHAENEKELFNKEQFQIFLHSQIFEKIVFLKNSSCPGEIHKIIETDDINDCKNNGDGVCNGVGRAIGL